MARKAAKVEQVESEDESQEVPESQSVTKAGAARAALAEGLESPEDAVAFIKKRFAIELSRQHFSAIKSQIRKKEREGGASVDGRKGKRGRPKGSTAQRVDGYLAPPPKPPAGGSGELLAALETMKPLIAQYGAEQVKRIVDLLG